MKKILGLDLGSGSIGWAFVHEAENDFETSRIVKSGVRVIHYGDNVVKKDRLGNISESREIIKDFEKGMSLSMNAGRTQMRGARRTLQRYKMRRAHLIDVLKKHSFIHEETPLTETGKDSTHTTLAIRAKAADVPVDKESLARVLLMINKKRGYKSNRKAQGEDDGSAIDSMGIAKTLYERDLTPGALMHERLKQGKKARLTFYRSDLQQEFDSIWNFQNKFYCDVLTSEAYDALVGLSKANTGRHFDNVMKIEQSEVKGSAEDKRLKRFELRAKAIMERLSLNDLATVFAEINGEISSSSGYLGEIGDRSKQLYFKKQTVGQYLFAQIDKNPHVRLKKQVFYRQDYLDEFERIWEVQSKVHPELTAELKREIRDITIFYQRRLKSQKHLIVDCELEKFHKAAPKSSPLFQEFRILQVLNNVEIKSKLEGKKKLGEEDRAHLRSLLRYSEGLSDSELLKILQINKNDGGKVNFKKLEGNRTFAVLTEKFLKILEYEGYDLRNIKDPDLRHKEIIEHFNHLGFDTSILGFDIDFANDHYDKQPAFAFWHLLYSSEDFDKLKIKLQEKYKFNEAAASILASTKFEPDHARLSSRAIRKLLPHMAEGHNYSEACLLAGYNHSKSMTAEENTNRKLLDTIELIPRNSLRNPIVEKILNQTINQVNAILAHHEMGRPDEIRIEMARELKSSADERQRMTEGIAKATVENERVRKKLKDEFGLPRVSKNDIVRYKLWEESGHISIYSGKPIPRSEIFGRNYDIDHIIPQSKLFDDSFSNKVLCERSWNEDKCNETAMDHLERKLSPEEFENYKIRVKKVYQDKKTKQRKLFMYSKDIPDDFIQRQLRESQYIARKAHELLLQVTRSIQPTVGLITDRLRQDWEIVDVLKELNWSKYESLGLTQVVEAKDGQRIKRIDDWNKRNDHRHHAMDAITVAFTKKAFVQYLNNLNARSKQGSVEQNIEQKHLYRDTKTYKLRFKPPMPNMRAEVKKSLEELLVSFKPSSRVGTKNKNKTKTKGGKVLIQEVLTPRGQLHMETVYGKIQQYETQNIGVNASLTYELALKIASKAEREAVLKRLAENDNDPKKAFTGKNSPTKNPIHLNGGAQQLGNKVKISLLSDQLTIRKAVSPDLKIDKVIDTGAKRILQKRLDDFEGNAKLAFSNLEENPIWLNEHKGIAIKSVKITGVKNALPLHTKRDNYGNLILDKDGGKSENDFVSLGNNHHVALYQDEAGNLHDEVISFFDASQRLVAGIPVIRAHSEFGLPLKFSLKQNEMFVFPADNFDPFEIDLLESTNYSLISPNLFRVQKFSKLQYGSSIIREFVFRHHLETTIETSKALHGTTYKAIKSLEPLQKIIKVHVNRLGQIIKVGE